MEIKNYSRPVNYYETDKMGIVHHSNYIRYFEETRIYAMAQMGCSVEMFEDLGLIIPNVDAYAKYLVPLRFGDRFSVKAKITEFNGVKFVLEYELFNQNNVLCATGHTTHCFANENLRPVSIKRTHKELFEIFKNQIEK